MTDLAEIKRLLEYCELIIADHKKVGYKTVSYDIAVALKERLMPPEGDEPQQVASNPRNALLSTGQNAGLVKALKFVDGTLERDGYSRAGETRTVIAEALSSALSTGQPEVGREELAQLLYEAQAKVIGVDGTWEELKEAASRQSWQKNSLDFVYVTADALLSAYHMQRRV